MGIGDDLVHSIANIDGVMIPGNVCFSSVFVCFDNGAKTIFVRGVLNLTNFAVNVGDRVTSSTVIVGVNRFPALVVRIPIGDIVVVVVITITLESEEIFEGSVSGALAILLHPFTTPEPRLPKPPRAAHSRNVRGKVMRNETVAADVKRKCYVNTGVANSLVSTAPKE